LCILTIYLLYTYCTDFIQSLYRQYTVTIQTIGRKQVPGAREVRETSFNEFRILNLTA
jgi:hypothetical protein